MAITDAPCGESSLFRGMEEAGGRRSWVQLRQAVRQARCRLYGLAPRLPTSLSFGRGRLYFLSPLAGGRESSLHYVDLPSPTAGAEEAPLLAWKPLLEPKFHVVHPPGRLSREEQLQWERRRLMVWGITAFDQQDGRFVFPAGGSLFYCDDAPDKPPPYFPVELGSGLSCARLNSQLCPCNRDLVAFVASGDLWVHHIASGCEARLTYCRKDGASVSESPVSVGIPSYVTQEEFNRYMGFWWCPVSNRGGSTYQILYEQVDESEVEVVHLPSFGDDGSMEEYRFPRAGTLNARSTLRLAQFSLDGTGQIGGIQLLSLVEPLSSVCTASEYLLRAGWTPDGSCGWAQMLDRRQQHLQLVLLPVGCFQPEGENPGSADIGPQVLWEETSHVWINVHDVLHFLRSEQPQTIRLLWASEESGFRHLYLLCLHLRGESRSDRVISKVQLTGGDWEVSEKDVWVDEVRRLVYFIGLKDTPLERHLYVVSMDRPLQVTRLTTTGYSHTIYMNKDLSMFVTVQSSLSQPPSSGLYELRYSEEAGLAPSPHLVAVLLEPPRVEPGQQEPELFSHVLSSGHTVYGMLFKPPQLEAGRKYPTVLTIYGGPEVQLVTNSFKGMRHLRQHLLASENYVVVVVDCRGSRHRGVEFESYIKGRMGTVEIADQVEVLQWLAESTGYIDLERIGIHGWSYGGYLSLMGLAQRPDIFRVAVAGAPVTSWSLYDTGYTERYMDTPAHNAAGYIRGSVLSYVNQFPTEQNRLLIVHGLMDENVHFTHTSQLVSALVKAGKPYQLQVYPAERHSLRHLDTSEHYETTLLSFLQDHL